MISFRGAKYNVAAYAAARIMYFDGPSRLMFGGYLVSLSAVDPFQKIAPPLLMSSLLQTNAVARICICIHIYIYIYIYMLCSRYGGPWGYSEFRTPGHCRLQNCDRQMFFESSRFITSLFLFP